MIEMEYAIKIDGMYFKNYIYLDVAIEFAINIVSEKEGHPEELTALLPYASEESIHLYLKKLADLEEAQEDLIKDKWLYIILD